MRLKKSLGQHFLKDKEIINRIVDEIKNLKSERLLEVGPGGGALTKHILNLPQFEFKAVELDDDKAAFLRRIFPSLVLIHGDFLQIEPPFASSFAVVGNFPYNISSQILFKILDWFPQVETVIGMFQKEVAERIVSDPVGRDYGILSVLVQYYYETEYLFDVGSECFVPPPKVESGVIQLQKREELLPVRSEQVFKKLVKTAFRQRRKTLRNNFKGVFTPEKLQDPLFDRRAETLSVAEFAELTFL